MDTSTIRTALHVGVAAVWRFSVDRPRLTGRSAWHRGTARPSGRLWPQWWAFSGPAILVSVGYMDPGNWGTDLQGGAQYQYGLLWVVGMASLMAIFMQVIAARFG